MHIRKKLIWTAMFSATMGLTACGGGSSGSSSSSSTLTGISGVVADGYLGNATVCLDINQNKLCEPSEPSSTTLDDGTGSYSLNATQAQINSAPILVIVTTSTTDTDLNGGTVTRAYTLSAPAGKPEFISPISTMIQAKIELNPTMTPEQAQASVKSDLGLSDSDNVDLYKDFIKEGEKGDAGYKALHQTAQVVARTIADFTEKLKDSGLDLGDDDIKNIQKMVAEAVMLQLPAIHAAAETHIEGGGEVDPDYADAHVEGMDKTGITTLTQEDADRKQSEYQITENTTVTSIVDAIGTDGLAMMSYDFETDEESGVYVSVFKVEGSVTKMYQSDGSLASFWIEDRSSDQDVKNDTSGVHADLYESSVMTTGANGNASFISKDGDKIDIYKFAQMPLSGETKDLKEVIDDGDYQGTDKVTFLEGDIAYQFSYTATPLIHALNLSSQKSTDVCGTLVNGASDTCFIATQNDGISINTSFSGLYNDLSLLDGAPSYDYGEEILYKVENQIVSQCKYKVDPDQGFMPLLPATCQEGSSPETLGTIKKGTFADGVNYILIPRAKVEDNGLISMRYSLVTTNETDKTIGSDDLIEKDGTPSTGVYKAYNLSAIKRIHAAAPAPDA